MREQDGGSSDTAAGDHRSGVLIAPGGSRQISWGVSRSRSKEPVLELQAAFFDDGSYEGDAQAVAEIIAQRIGSEIQRQRIDRLIEAILADDKSNEDAKVARIRSEVAQLTEDPEPGMVERVRSQFPALSGEALESAKRWLGFGLNSEKQSLDFELKELLLRRTEPRPDTLSAWWSRRRK